MRRLRLHLALCISFAPAADGQTLLWETVSTTPGDRVGESVAGGADLDQDGFDDVLIGAPGLDTGGKFGNGAVRAISGADGSVLLVKVGDQSFDGFGSAVAVTDDIDGDGHPDFVVGAEGAALGADRPGLARAVSGRTGVTLFTAWGATDGDLLGAAVVGRLDWDGDGIGDIAAGAPDGTYLLSAPGYVQIHSGATGALLDTLSPGGLDEDYGVALATGDVTGDGVQDLVVGATGGGLQTGLVEVFDGASHALVWSRSGDFGTGFGSAVGVGDANGDGFGDVFVGAPQDGLLTLPVGSVRVFESPTGIERQSWFGLTLFGAFGTSLALIGDVDEDGLTDLAVGAPVAGRVRVFSTGTQAELFRLEQAGAVSDFGRSVARAGDFDGNGIRDLVVGAPATPAEGGAAYVHSGACLGVVSYCTAGTSASGCQAQLSAAGVPSASAASGFTLSAVGVEGSKDGLFFFGSNGRQASPWGNGTSFQCVVPPVNRGGLLSGTGSSGQCDGAFHQDLTARWAAKPSQNPGAGSVVQAQLWYRDPLNTSNQTTSTSDALEFCVLP